MKNNYILFLIFMSTLFISCKKNELTKTEVYNKNANELISQILEKNKCNCILEIPKESMIEISKIDNPKYDIITTLKKQLNVKTNENLDSLIKVSKNFRLDPKIIKKNNIQIVSQKDILNIRNGKDNKTLKKCGPGIIYILKPIFNENYKKAVFEYDYALTCVRLIPSPIYELKNGKWIRIEK